MLNNKGVYTDGIYVGLRLVYLREDKRSEMLIIYGERTDFRGINCSSKETSEPLLEQMSLQVLNELRVKPLK
jgi:hypothetical protein